LTRSEAWDSGSAYERYAGRWSRLVAVEFLRWLAPDPGLAWADVGCGVAVRAVEIPPVFDSFDDHWQPFPGRTGAAPTYLASAPDEIRERIRLHLKAWLAPTSDAPITLTARAWAIRSVVDGGRPLTT